MRNMGVFQETQLITPEFLRFAKIIKELLQTRVSKYLTSVLPKILGTGRDRQTQLSSLFYRFPGQAGSGKSIPARQNRDRQTLVRQNRDRQTMTGKTVRQTTAKYDM